MKKIIPFKKDIIFKTNIAEVVSISLEHSLKIEPANLISGKFIVSGEYKATDESIDTESFNYDLPFSINMDDRYVLDNVFMDIDDFYYEIIDDNVLSINIEVLVDKIEEKPLEKPEQLVEKTIVEEIEDEDLNKRCIEEENDIKIFDNISSSTETYKSYTIYIMRDGDNIEMLLNKYEVTKEQLEDYNDLTDIKVGDKIIIPC